MSENTILSEQLSTAAVGVLGSMLIDEKAVGPMLMAVSESDFQLPEFRTVFRAISELYSQGRPVDGIVVNEHLGGSYAKLIADLIERTPTSANAREYAKLLKSSSRLWQLRQIGDQLSQAEDEDTCRELMDRANLLLCQRPGIRRLTMQQGFREFFARHDPKTKPDYVSWGMERLDSEIHVGGGDMVVIGGYPSAGKTALALQIAFHMAKTRRVGFFSYETAADKLHDRTVACQTETSFRRIMTGTMVESDYQQIYAMQKHLTGPSMELVEADGMTVSGISSYAMANHYDVIVVDYLQKIPASRAGRYLSDFERVSQVSNDLQQLGRRTGKLVIALSQLSRAERARRKDRDNMGKDSTSTPAPTMASLRQSGQIEQDADVVMLLYREFPDDNKRLWRILDVAKNKDGESNLHISLDFDGDKQRFRRSNRQFTPPPAPELPVQQSIFRPMPANTPTPFESADAERSTSS